MEWPKLRFSFRNVKKPFHITSLATYFRGKVSCIHTGCWIGKTNIKHVSEYLLKIVWILFECWILFKHLIFLFFSLTLNSYEVPSLGTVQLPQFKTDSVQSYFMLLKLMFENVTFSFIPNAFWIFMKRSPKNTNFL